MQALTVYKVCDLIDAQANLEVLLTSVVARIPPPHNAVFHSFLSPSKTMIGHEVTATGRSHEAINQS